MSTASERGKARRRFQVETLEGRTLLSTARPSASALEFRPAHAPQVPVLLGQITGFAASDGQFSGTLNGNRSYSGNGHANAVGFVYLGVQHRQTAVAGANGSQTLTLNNGSAVLTVLRGDQIDILYTGTGTTTRRGRTTLHLQGFINSGTGTYDGATGSFRATGTADPSGRFTLHFVIGVNYFTPA